MGLQLTGKTAIVTGANSGIGRACARALAEAEAQVVLVGRNRTRLDAIAGELGDAGHAVAVDLSAPDAAQTVFDAAIHAYGKVDIVLSNAGMYLGGDFATMDLGELQQIIATNVYGAMALVRAALPHMIARGDGDVVVTSSVAGHQAIHWEPAYSASKHAIQAFVHTIRRQLVGTGIRIGAVAPGVVLNELWGFDKAEAEARLASGEGITSEDVADAVRYMLTRPRRVNIRDLVILPSAQDI